MSVMAERVLNADEVVRTALSLLDEVALRGFTMRALAARLGTYPATIYWHVGNRTEVLSAINKRVLDDMALEIPDPASTSWDEWLVETARAYRRSMQAHPALATWAVTHFEARVPAPDFLEQVTGVLFRAGFRGVRLAAAFNAYLGSLVGWIGMELIADDPELGSNPEEMRASVDELSAEDYPTIAAHLDHLADRAFAFRWHGGVSNPLDDAFEFALATWITGLRGMLLTLDP
jgi:AcrR family transcriptional regulator